MLLKERPRAILFWFTVAMILLVAVMAVVTILRVWGSSQASESPPSISPGEVTLCPGDRHTFAVDGTEVVWEATGGTVSEGGLFTAGDVPGDYAITASRRDAHQQATAIVHIVACTPPAPTEPPPTPTPQPTATPTPQPTTPPDDSRDDVVPYEGGTPVEDAPDGVDIRAASLAPDLRASLGAPSGVPAELSGWAAEGDLLLWIVLHTPIPDPPSVYTEWLFALDLDGDKTTGRPAGTVRINPDLGDEAVLGISYDPVSDEYVPYLLVWDTAQGDWQAVHDAVQFRVGETRTVVGLILPLQKLVQAVAQTTGITVIPEAAKGRAAVLSYVGEQAVIDFYPDRAD